MAGQNTIPTISTSASNVVVGVFNDPDQARDAILKLREAGFSQDNISMVTRSAGENAGHLPNSNIVTDAAIGAAAGSLGGIVLSLAAMAVPGVGMVVAAGPLLAALGGAGIGAVAGGLIGALTDFGVPEEDAQYYAEGVRRGDAVVTIRANTAADAERARNIMNDSGAVDIAGRVSSWRTRGWMGHNPGDEPLSEDEVRREREYYAAFTEQAYEWEHMNEKERQHAGPPEEGTAWPHEEAHDLGESLVKGARVYERK
jgi:uncharacterized membrane protein